jgi:MoxR-like ATPase
VLLRGHALVEGAPGLAANAGDPLSRLLTRLSPRAMHLRPDARVVGTNILNLSTGAFQFHQGPVFTHLPRGRSQPDAAARASPPVHGRTAGDGGWRPARPLGFFTVFATQNRSSSGTCPLPEAQIGFS